MPFSPRTKYASVPFGSDWATFLSPSAVTVHFVPRRGTSGSLVRPTRSPLSAVSVSRSPSAFVVNALASANVRLRLRSKLIGPFSQPMSVVRISPNSTRSPLRVAFEPNPLQPRLPLTRPSSPIFRYAPDGARAVLPSTVRLSTVQWTPVTGAGSVRAEPLPAV